MYFIFSSVPSIPSQKVPQQAQENILTPMLMKLYPHGQKEPVWTHTYHVDTDISSPIELLAETLYFSPAKNGPTIPTVQLSLDSIDHITFHSSMSTEKIELQQSPSFASTLQQENFSQFLSNRRIPLSYEIEVCIFFKQLTEAMLVEILFEIPQLQRLYENASFMANGNKDKVLTLLEKQAPKEWKALRQIILPEPVAAEVAEPVVVEPVVTQQQKCHSCLGLQKTIRKLKKNNKSLQEYFNLTANSGHNLRRK
jgi:hypothetical protein